MGEEVSAENLRTEEMEYVHFVNEFLLGFRAEIAVHCGLDLVESLDYFFEAVWSRGVSLGAVIAMLMLTIDDILRNWSH